MFLLQVCAVLKKNIRRSAWIFICLVLNACSSPAPKPTITSFTAEGLVGVKVAQTQNSANFIWRQDDQAYHIEIYGPLGVDAVYLESEGAEVTLTLGNQEHYTAGDPQALMQKVLGWSLPISGLKYWLLAQPVPNTPVTLVRDDTGRISSLMQQGWNINYTWAPQQNFPHKIVLTRPGVRGTIVINKMS
jgi:outer membrane lipoprotein LolB